MVIRHAKGARKKMLDAAKREIKIPGWTEGDKYIKYKDVGNIRNRDLVIFFLIFIMYTEKVEKFL